MIFSTAIPQAAPADIIAWAEATLKVDGHSFDSARTPQLIEPIRSMSDADTRIGTLIKPVQIGGSTAGEVVLNYWAAFWSGLVQFNWQDDQAAAKRWHERILPALESNRDIKRTGHRFEELVCAARYPNATVRVQGVFMESALDSDTVPLQINEEVHLWKPGFLGKARRRQTQVWNAKAFDISNASNTGDQLQSAFEDGTMEEWEVLCPKCGLYHAMHFRFNPSKPELGGLRWDSAGCKMENGRFNYNKLEATIRYQFPCGHEIRDVAAERRTLAGRYSTPRNEGAHISHRSWNFEAVSCDAIRWLPLIQEWHSSIRALKAGDGEPMRRFVTERECRFYSEEMRPFSGAVITTTAAKKNREGLTGEVAKIWAADWQQGFKHLGELTHYWLVIESVLKNCNSQVIFEGKADTDAEVLQILADHGIKPDFGMADGVIDASKNTKQILSFCYRSGINAVVGGDGGKGGWRHPDGAWRYYSPKKYIYSELNMPPRYDKIATRDGWIESPDEPFILKYNKAGLLKNHFFIREMKQRATQFAIDDKREVDPLEYVERIIPEDVSDDYKNHHEAWERDLKATGVRKMGEVEGFKQVRRADHLMSCTTYIDMLKDFSGLLGERLAELGINTETTNDK